MRFRCTHASMSQGCEELSAGHLCSRLIKDCGASLQGTCLFRAETSPLLPSQSLNSSRFVTASAILGSGDLDVDAWSVNSAGVITKLMGIRYREGYVYALSRRIDYLCGPRRFIDS